MKPPLTEQQKQDKKQLAQLDNFAKAIKMQWSFHKVRTFYDLLKACGFSDSAIRNKYFASELSKVLSFQDVSDYFSDRRIELTTSFWLRDNPPQITHEKEESSSEHRNGTNTELQIVDRVPDKITDKTPTAAVTRIEAQQEQNSSEAELEKEFKVSPNESKDIFFFWFQKRAVMKLLKGILGES